jgi:hypothetical protein
VSRVVDVTEISAMVAAAGVLIGVVYYILDMRNQRKIRQTDLLVRLFSNMINKDWLEAWEKVRDREHLDYSEYKEKYGFVEANQVYLFYDQLGRLLQKGLIDIDLLPVEVGQVTDAWEKLGQVVVGSRKKFNEPKLGSGFEYLYNEVKKIDQKLQQSKT